MENNIVKVSLWGQAIAPLTASIHNPLLAQGEVYLGNKKDLYIRCS